MKSKGLILILILTTLAVVGCQPRDQKPSVQQRVQQPLAPDQVETKTETSPNQENPLLQHNLDSALEAIEALEELGVE